MNPLNWLLNPGHPAGKTTEVVLWWELRRIPYNLIVGAVGVAAIVFMELLGDTFIPPGEDMVEPLALVGAIFMFGLLANLGYTMGWIMELNIPFDEPEKHRAFRGGLKRALKWSCAIATLPVWISILAWILHPLYREQ